MSKRVIVLSCMHGRHSTVEYCLNKMPFLDIVMIYSTNEDREFLKAFDLFKMSQHENRPLSKKWNHAVESLRDIDFDGVILLGSDDFIDYKFLDFAANNIDGVDMIGFTDIYFKKGNRFFYWKGYEGKRAGEPAGAGKVYSKTFLERIDYDLFRGEQNSSLDGLSWKVCKEANINPLITSLLINDLTLVDIKDGEGMTSLDRIKNLTEI